MNTFRKLHLALEETSYEIREMREQLEVLKQKHARLERQRAAHLDGACCTTSLWKSDDNCAEGACPNGHRGVYDDGADEAHPFGRIRDVLEPIS
jgi:hypothetical protein